ncbi:MAG: hypothetical protein EA343_08050 [Nodularia sp. (in: Bacteria)]|nr:MAG: hypothetical protein EA343_08050 [Nodularia sp. (in: cyanobacteria)]
MAKKHPNKEIRAALDYAVEQGWEVEEGGSHAWGKMYCPYNDSECRCGEFCITNIVKLRRIYRQISPSIIIHHSETS